MQRVSYCRRVPSKLRGPSVAAVCPARHGGCDIQTAAAWYGMVWYGNVWYGMVAALHYNRRRSQRMSSACPTCVKLNAGASSVLVSKCVPNKLRLKTHIHTLMHHVHLFVLERGGLLGVERCEQRWARLLTTHSPSLDCRARSHMDYARTPVCLGLPMANKLSPTRHTRDRNLALPLKSLQVRQCTGKDSFWKHHPA